MNPSGQSGQTPPAPLRLSWSMTSALPLGAWSETLHQAVADVCKAGDRLIDSHSAASEEAAEMAKRWGLHERQVDEKRKLDEFIECSFSILAALSEVRTVNAGVELIDRATSVIEENLPLLEEAFLVARTSAQDLLLWSEREGKLEGSTEPAAYRAAYRALIQFGPTLRPYLAELEKELAIAAARNGDEPHLRRLLVQVGRFQGLLDTSRRFIISVIEPPLQLVFQETEPFHREMDRLSPNERGRLASAVNDLCQTLLYDPANFEEKTIKIPVNLGETMEASLFAFGHDAAMVFFSVEEDPIFSELTIHLLRACPKVEASAVQLELVDHLYSGLSIDG